MKATGGPTFAHTANEQARVRLATAIDHAIQLRLIAMPVRDAQNLRVDAERAAAARMPSTESNQRFDAYNIFARHRERPSTASTDICERQSVRVGVYTAIHLKSPVVMDG